MLPARKQEVLLLVARAGVSEKTKEDFNKVLSTKTFQV
jgi:hypothetical protein